MKVSDKTVRDGITNLTGNVETIYYAEETSLLDGENEMKIDD